jgi:hypothetical protein
LFSSTLEVYKKSLTPQGGKKKFFGTAKGFLSNKISKGLKKSKEKRA